MWWFLVTFIRSGQIEHRAVKAESKEEAVAAVKHKALASAVIGCGAIAGTAVVRFQKL